MTKETVRQSLEPLFKEAEEKGLWFFTVYQHLWFSPKELREAQAEGRFCWGPSNWQLRDPKELLEQVRSEIHRAQERLKEIHARIAR